MLPTQYCVTGPRWVNACFDQQLSQVYGSMSWVLPISYFYFSISHFWLHLWSHPSMPLTKWRLVRRVPALSRLPSNYLTTTVCPTVMYHRLQTWWGHQMEKFSAILALCAGNSPITVYTTDQKYGIFGKYNWNARIWHFNLLRMVWHQPQINIVILM